MKKAFALFFCTALLFSPAWAEPALSGKGEPEKKEFREHLPPPPPHHDGHGPNRRFRKGPGKDPMLGFIEDSDFSPEEKQRLKGLLAKDPGAARKEIRRMMKERRKLWAQKILALREQYKSAKTDDARKAAEEALRRELASDAERRLVMNKKMLANMQKQLANMQKRLESMQKDYEERVKGKDEFISSRLKELTGDTVPERLLRSAQ